MSADNGKKRRKLHRKADDPNYNSERQRFYRKIRQQRFDPNHPDADLQKYSNIEHAFKFLDARVVVVASPDKSITANLKDSAKDCVSQMRKDSTEEQIPQSDKELFNSFQLFFDSAFGATQFASWVVGNICLILVEPQRGARQKLSIRQQTRSRMDLYQYQ